jgi:PAS domain-containing protein
MKPNSDTTHQNVSEALQKEVELYRRIIEALSDFVFIFDENFRILPAIKHNFA